MAKPWREVEQSDGYMALGGQEKQAAKQEYFDTLIAPQVPTSDRGLAWQEFNQSTSTPETGTQEVKEPSAFDKEDIEWGDVLSQAVDNFPESGKRLLGDLWGIVSEPKEAVTAMAGATFGLMEKLTPSPTPEQQEREAKGDLLIGAMKDRYGSVNRFKHTLSEDPVGTLLDVSSVLTPALKGVQLGGAAAKIGALEKAGQYGSKMAALLDPMKLGQEAAKGAVLIPKNLPLDWYADAAAFRTNLTQTGRRKLAEFAFDQKIMPTTKGMDRLREKLNVVSNYLNDAIDKAGASGQKIPMKELTKHFGELESRLVKQFPDQGPQIRKKLAKIKNNIADTSERYGDMTVEELHWFKVQQNQELATFYKNASKRTLKHNVALQYKQNAVNILEEIIPDYQKLNEKWGLFAELEQEIGSTARTLTHSSPINVRTFVGTEIGRNVAGPIGAAVGGGSVLINRPTVRLKLANALYRMQKIAPHIKINQPLLDALLTAPERYGVTDEIRGEQK